MAALHVRVGVLQNIRRRAHTVRWLLAGPAEWGLAFRVALSAAVVSSLKRVVPLSKLAHFLQRRQPAKPGWANRDQKTLALVRWIYGVREGRCLDRALVLSRLLAETHDDVQLVVGMRKASGRLSGHAWVILDGQPFGENGRSLEEFEPVFVLRPRHSIHPDSTAA